MNNDTRQLANCIRALSMDAVQRANSGHPGMPMGMADVATVLFGEFLRFAPQQPLWHNRDRFVLSAGHGSMLLYALLYLTGYPAMDIRQIQNFRQWQSLTPGHPEFAHPPGVEMTAGPLGQGLAAAAGMALAGKMRAARLQQHANLSDYRVYVVAGDGCLAEGISHETASFAGHMKLSNLIVLFDDNNITIDGRADLAVSDQHLKRFEAYQWHTIAIDGHDAAQIRAALTEAQHADKPTLIACKTIIGYGAPNKQGSHHAHGAPLGEDEIAAARQQLQWPHPPFEIPDELLSAWRNFGEKGTQLFQDWQDAVTQAPPDIQQQLQPQDETTKSATAQVAARAMVELKQNLGNAPQDIATRKASENAINALFGKVNNLVGGSADLTGSNNTKAAAMRPITAAQMDGDYIHYGVREHAMGGLMNGLALCGWLPYGGTFLVFSDYCRPAIRMSALVGAHVIYVMTHDSIGLGEDGPTHQPVEHLPALRAMPGLRVYRPADAVETAECWQCAIADAAPSVIALSRQTARQVRLGNAEKENLCMRGGYVLRDVGKRDATILSSGTEVALALDAAALLAHEGLQAAVVSMPCWERFDAQPLDKQKVVLGDAPRFAVEAACGFGWERYVPSAHIFALQNFGASAPAKTLFKEFGFTAEVIAQKIAAAIRNSG